MIKSESLQKKLSHYRISPEEYETIKGLLGREPEGLEWALFSALWSEHCSYKSSRKHLKKFALKSDKVLESMGENAGVLDLGQGERIAFKMESHNHPSFIEPFQGAATGVGGILRDIFTMGARPIAILDYLCFGEPSAPRMAELVEGVVSGISFYGNCVGVPTVGGKTQFDASYNGNILVNAFALGLFRPHEKIVTSKLRGPGNWVVYVGAKTGRDGVHGASMASESFEADSESKRPTVQIGDPFFEKLLIESCLEVFDRDLVVAIQDMGAAGLTSSSFEMASKGGLGLTLHLDQVPLRDDSITPEEILLSESQERMLLVCEPEKYEQIREIFHRWNLDAVKIGEVRSEPEVQLFWRGERLCEIHPDLLTERAPQYDRPYHPWVSRHHVEAKRFELIVRAEAAAHRAEETFQDEDAAHEENGPAVDDKDNQDFAAQDLDGLALSERLASAALCSRKWIYRQYDQRVGGQTVRDAGHQLSVVRLPDSGRALGMVAGCRADLMRLDARLGAQDAELRPILQLASKGFEAMGTTDCLNFGNPEKPEVMSELVASIEAIAEVARVFDAPVISGNVSLYNETMGQGVTPTPAIVVVGLKDTLELPSEHFVKAGNPLVLIQLDQVKVACTDLKPSMFTGEFDLVSVKEFCLQLRQAVQHRAVKASKLVGRGSLPIALAEMSLSSEQLGAKVSSNTLFSSEQVNVERSYEVVIELDQALASQWREQFQSSFEQIEGCQVIELGVVAPKQLTINQHKYLLDELKLAHSQGWEKNFVRLS